jgi:O-antigen ligase
VTQLSAARVPAQDLATEHPSAIPMWWAWAALLVNVLAFLGATLVPVPGVLGQLVTQGSLPLAVLLALLANRHGLIRPNLFLVGLTTLAVVAFMVSLHNEFVLGSTFRAVRFLGFVTVLWLLTPWWGRQDMLLLRVHRTCLAFLLGSVVLGFALRPGMALGSQNRLSGIVWPIPPTQVGHYSAVMLGTTVVLWMCHVVGGRSALLWILLSTATLLASHTRTALIAVMAGLCCALASLFLSQSRVRRTFLLGVIAAGIVALFASEIRAWALRGQTAEEAGQLTGRTKVWTEVLHAHRSPIHDLFGSGLSNLSWNGLPIDSTWIGTYLDQGIFGIVLIVALLTLLLLGALSTPAGPARAIALFLIAYCVFASITETGLGAPSPYLLDLTVAASLLGVGSKKEWRR